jgi:hypothetical protein
MSMSEKAHDEAMLITAVMTLAQRDGAYGRGRDALLSYPEAPSMEQLDADHPRGSAGRDGIEAVLEAGEMLGAYAKHGALSVELIRDVIWVEGTWARLERYVQDLRAAVGEDILYEHFEALATQVS